MRNIYLLLALLIVSGCGTNSPSDVGVIAAWKTYEQGDQIPDDFGLYTYLLGGTGPVGQQRLIDFDSVVREIAPASEALVSDGVFTRQINLILLPSESGKVSCSFGRSLLAQFRVTYRSGFNGVGPYLVTTSKPFMLGSPQEDVLVADLSTYNTAVFPDIARRYGEYFASSSLSGSNQFSSLASRVVDVLSDISDFAEAFNALGAGKAYASGDFVEAGSC